MFVSYRRHRFDSSWLAEIIQHSAYSVTYFQNFTSCQSKEFLEETENKNTRMFRPIHRQCAWIECSASSKWCLLLVTLQRTLIKKEIVMNMEKMNIPPSPYRCRVLRPVLSMRNVETNVIATMMAPMPMVANFALSSVNPELANKLVE